MGTISYNREACQKLSLDEFKKQVGWMEYFRNMTESQWQAEYITATGFNPEYVVNNSIEARQVNESTEQVEPKPVEMKKKPQKRRG